jgi:hypothetical protein
VLRGDHRAVIAAGSWLVPTFSASMAGSSVDQALGRAFAHRHHHRQRHAALARRTEGRAHQIVHRAVEIGIGHDDAVVLGAAHGLHALAVGAPRW